MGDDLVVGADTLLGEPIERAVAAPGHGAIALKQALMDLAAAHTGGSRARTDGGSRVTGDDDGSETLARGG